MGHLQLSDFSSDNYRLLEKPNKNFSAERNYKVINSVLEENDKMQNQLSETVKKNTENVTDILASFAKYKLDLGGGKQLEEWLGPGWMTKVGYSNKLIEKIKMFEAIKAENKRKGNDKFINYYLT